MLGRDTAYTSCSGPQEEHLFSLKAADQLMRVNNSWFTDEGKLGFPWVLMASSALQSQRQVSRPEELVLRELGGISTSRSPLTMTYWWPAYCRTLWLGKAVENLGDISQRRWDLRMGRFTTAFVGSAHLNILPVLGFSSLSLEILRFSVIQFQGL